MRISPEIKQAAFLTTFTLAMVVSGLVIAAAWGLLH